MRGAVHRIWAGERNEIELAKAREGGGGEAAAAGEESQNCGRRASGRRPNPPASRCLLRPPQDKDTGSHLAIKAVLFHAVANDKKYGGKRVWQPEREQA